MSFAVSIIIPVYKAEATLQQCVNCILAQEFQDFELILVNDGSPDSSGTICDEYAQKDPRIRVIHQKNQGAAAARNAGLDAARGEYVAFCDSDDVVSPLWLERMISLAKPDVLSVCSHCKSPDNLGQPKSLSVPSGQILGSDHYWRFNRCGIAGFLWNALYYRPIIEDNHLRLRTQHDKGDYNEDLLFALSYVKHINKIVYTGFSDYLYATHEDSLSHSFPEMYFQKYEEKYFLWKEFLSHDPEGQRELASVMLFHFLQALHNSSFKKFKQIVNSTCMQECVRMADTSRENPAIISLIKKKAVLRLWIRYKIHHMKGKLL
jgi:glycosyltransferase involved in cell wall biosynthesis